MTDFTNRTMTESTFTSFIRRQVLFSALCLATALVCRNSFALETQLSQNEAESVISATLDGLRARLQNNGADRNQPPTNAMAVVDEVITPHIDLARMTRFLLGKHWSRLDNQQRQQFSRSFHLWLLGTYADRVSDYRDTKVTFLPTPNNNGASDEATVRSLVALPNGDTKRIDYRLHNTNGEWKVYDVIGEGVSFVVTYRQTLDEDVRRRGIDGVLTGLAAAR